MRILLCALSLVPVLAHAELPALIPRKLLAGNPERSQPRISPDGKRLAWRAPDKKDVMQVWVKTIGKDDDKIVTDDKKRGIQRFMWAWDDRHLLYLQDSDGDENFHVYSVDLVTSSVRDLTPFQGIRASVEEINPRFPNSALVTMNLRNREVMDVHRLDLTTGAIVPDTENPGDVAAWLTDDNMVVRGAWVKNPDGGTEIRVRPNAKAKWQKVLSVDHTEELAPQGFSKDGKSLFMISSVGQDKTRLYALDLATKKERDIAKHADADVDSVEINPFTLVVEAVAFDPLRKLWTVVDPKVKGDFEALAKVETGDLQVVSRDRADKNWIVAFIRDKGAVHWHVWDRTAKKAQFLMAHQPKLDELPLAEMKAMKIKARDGLELPAYLTLPIGVEPSRLPLVLNVHGGPWARDNWGFDQEAQLLANRGYAVLQVNFRGSTGFGKKFLHAADKQWGLAMHDDLVDAVKWAVQEGIADPKRVVVYGGSYGGYAALAGAAFTPDLFKAAVDVVGPSNLFTLLASIPPYWKPIVSIFHTRMGNPEKDKELLTKASPLFSADKIKIPLLIAQGANDPRVKQAESEQIVSAIEKRGGRVTYVLYTDEGHGFRRPENNLDFTGRLEQFLAEQLGGRAEPLEKIAGTTAVVKVIGKK